MDFRAFSSSLDRFITYPSSSVKVQAIAAARKSLRMGAVAVFAASKRGPQGVAGLAEELIAQLDASIPLPDPIDFANRGEVAAAEEYFRREFGPDWIATRLVARGAVMHHGDIPQETREVVETLVRDGSVHFAICTSTLAEGVNLPIRTLVLYSVQRQRPMLSRDIKNLVGRTGRAGSTTKGLVICANPSQWTLVAPVAKQDPSEAVYGALVDLAKRIVNVLALQNIDLTNQVMERSPVLQSLLDGVDSSLIDLAAEEIGVDELVNMAKRIARQTYASSLTDDATQRVIDTVFELRARRVIELRENGRLHWFQETGARIRMLDSVERILRPKIEAWDQISEATDPKLIEVMVGWAFGHQEVRASLRRAYGLNGKPDVTHLQPTLTKIVGLWLAGRTFHEISNESEVPISVVVSIYSGVISYQLQSLVEQAVAILGKVLDAENIVLSPFVQDFVEYLRLGVPTAKARRYAVAGIRHRRAAVVMGEDDAMPELAVENGESFLVMCLRLLEGTENYYRLEMGNLVYENTVKDIQSYVRRS